MIDPQDIHPLTDFQRNTKETLRRLKKTRRPEVLTVNGRPAVIVQDAEAYRRTIAQLRRDYEIEAVRVGIAEMKAGKGRPAKEVFDELRAKYLSGRRGQKKPA